MHNHFNDLFSSLKTKKNEKTTTVSVRVTPEISFMLKVLSSRECYDFSISKVFIDSFSEKLKNDILNENFHEKENEINTENLLEFIEEIINDEDFIVNNSKDDAISLLFGSVDEHSHGKDITFNNEPEIFEDSRLIEFKNKIKSLMGDD